MRCLLLAVTLLALTASPARAAWERIGDGVATYDERWMVVDEDGALRAYDTQLRQFGTSIVPPPGCSLGVAAHGRALLPCRRGEPGVLTGFKLVDLTTGAIRPLRRTGNRKWLRYDTMDQMGRRWAGGLSCPSAGQKTCGTAYMNLRTGRRIRFADHAPRDLDAKHPRVKRTGLPPALFQTGPPRWELLLQREGRPDVTLRGCHGHMHCWFAHIKNDVAFWQDDDGLMHTYDTRTDAARSLAYPAGAPPSQTTGATSQALFVTVAGDAPGVYVTPR